MLCSDCSCIGQVCHVPASALSMLKGTMALMKSHALSLELPCRMGLNLYSMQLNEMTPGLEAKLPPNDSRWRQDLRAIETGDYAQVHTSPVKEPKAETDPLHLRNGTSLCDA